MITHPDVVSKDGAQVRAPFSFEMGSPRYFSVEEANAVLAEVEPLVAQLLKTRARVVRLRSQIEDIVDDTSSDVGGPVASDMARDFLVIEKLIERIESYGCIIKSVNVGLLDFLAKRNGRHVYLCWRYGEPRVEYYHELHTGYNGRRQI